MKKNNLILAFLLFASSIYSQSDCCGEAYKRLGIRIDVEEGEDTCFVVAAALQSDLSSTRASQPEPNTLPVKPTPRDLQTRKTNVPNSVAAINQGDAAPSLYPFALGGGSVGGTGSDAGTNALTTLSLNPAIFFC